MADKKISELTEKTTISDTDEVPIVDNDGTPETKKITKANLLKDYVPYEGATSNLDLITTGMDFSASFIACNELEIDLAPLAIFQDVQAIKIANSDQDNPIEIWNDGGTGAGVLKIGDYGTPNPFVKIADGTLVLNGGLVINGDSGNEITGTSTQFDFMASGTDHALIDLSLIINGQDRTFILPDKDGTFAMLDSDYIPHRVATYSDIDFTVLDTYSLLTVPTGKKLVVLDLIVHITSASGLNGDGVGKLQWGTGPVQILNTSSGDLGTSGKFVHYSTKDEGTLPYVPAGDSLEFEITTAETGTELVVDIDVIGYFI